MSRPRLSLSLSLFPANNDPSKDLDCRETHPAVTARFFYHLQAKRDTSGSFRARISTAARKRYYFAAASTAAAGASAAAATATRRAPITVVYRANANFHPVFHVSESVRMVRLYVYMCALAGTGLCRFTAHTLVVHIRVLYATTRPNPSRDAPLFTFLLVLSRFILSYREPQVYWQDQWLLIGIHLSLSVPFLSGRFNRNGEIPGH